MKKYVCVAYGNKNTGWREPIHIGPANWWIQEKFCIEARNEVDACKEVDKYKSEHGNPEWKLVKVHPSPDGNHYFWDCLSASRYY